MNKIFVFFCLIFVACLIVKGQTEGGVVFPNGIVVANMTEISVVTDKVEISDGKIVNIKLSEYRGGYFTSSDGDKVHRILTFEKRKEYSGYTLEFSPHSEKDKFIVKIKPLSIKPSKRIVPSIENWSFRPLAKYPDEMIVNDGDTIFIDVLENSTTKEKVTDLIKITRKKREFGGYFAERKSQKPIKDFTVEDIELRLMKYKVLVNNEKTAEIGGGAMGNLIWVHFPNGKNKGRFIFSLIQRDGYDFKKIGTISSEKIEFNFNGDNYKFTTETPILLASETWNLWVLYDPEYKTDSKSFVNGAAGGMEGIFIKQ